MESSRYIVGIDLGTTNSALAYVDVEAADSAPRIEQLAIPQVVQNGVVDDRTMLPSYLYLPGKNEVPGGSLKLPWDSRRDYCVGEFARIQGSIVPTRLVASAKSWLCHGGVDRRSPLLPWKAPEDGRRVSPLEASTYYLKHFCETWNHRIGRGKPDCHLENQDVILTVPASFDAVARELTMEAARNAGLQHVTLLEEPQAAFYSWLESRGEEWRREVEVGDGVLVCDVGGGTTDFTLIAVSEDQGQLNLTRIAVGDHILLGGDNMDLALAHNMASLITSKGPKLDSGQMLMLWHSCRSAKESLFSDEKAESAPVTVLGRGSKVIGGTIKSELNRSAVESVLVDGFFPKCSITDDPKPQRTLGLQELGLPYASDPAITKHLGQFLRRHEEALMERTPPKRKKKASSRPTALLFNGGVFKAAPLRERILDVLTTWSANAKEPPPRVLEGSHLDLAVSRGAASYGLARRGKGIRIRGGTARSYYVGIESSLPAVPGALPPLKALCVVPFGMEEGTEADLPGQQFGLVVGTPAEFRFLASSIRRHDAVGTLIEEWQGEIEELTPLMTQLEGKSGQMVPVHLHSKVTEMGTLELSCLSSDNKKRWKLEFNVRDRPN